MICRYCGKHLEESAAFCKSCGRRLTASEPGVSVAPPAVSAAPALSGEGVSRRPLAIRSGKGGYWPLLAVLGVLVVLFLTYKWYEDGVRLTVVTTPPGVAVSLDGRFLGVSATDSGRVSVEHIARGPHVLTLNHDGYQQLTHALDIGSFALSPTAQLSLQVQTFQLTVVSRPPGSSVFLDGKPTGVSDSNGTLLLPAVPFGQHSLKVQEAGLPSATMTVNVSSDQTLTFDLAEMAARITREKSAGIERARALFQQQQFDAAIAACDEVLGIVPGDPEAQRLRTQIQQAKAILSR